MGLTGRCCRYFLWTIRLKKTAWNLHLCMFLVFISARIASKMGGKKSCNSETGLTGKSCANVTVTIATRVQKMWKSIKNRRRRIAAGTSERHPRGRTLLTFDLWISVQRCQHEDNLISLGFSVLESSPICGARPGAGSRRARKHTKTVKLPTPPPSGVLQNTKNSLRSLSNFAVLLCSRLISA